MAEDLTDYFTQNDLKVRYIHHNVETMERQEIIRELRTGVFDVLVGINLLREGLDIPEVSLVAILDADKEGFLRSESSLIQTIGRAARNANGTVIMYADSITGSMERAIRETERRRKIQDAYNKAHGIVPRTVFKEVRDVIRIGKGADTVSDDPVSAVKPVSSEALKGKDLDAVIETLTKEMKEAARQLDFEKAAYLRDRIRAMQEESAKPEKKKSNKPRARK
jgi:excinuclease ABC subunit B